MSRGILGFGPENPEIQPGYSQPAPGLQPTHIPQLLDFQTTPDFQGRQHWSAHMTFPKKAVWPETTQHALHDLTRQELQLSDRQRETQSDQKHAGACTHAYTQALSHRRFCVCMPCSSIRGLERDRALNTQRVCSVVLYVAQCVNVFSSYRG